MRHVTAQTLVCALILGGGLTLALGAQASQQLASDKGCYNCHGAQLRGDALSFEHLADRLSRLKGDAAAEQKFAAKLREGEFLQHFTVHQQLSPDTAQKLIHWLAEGAK